MKITSYYVIFIKKDAKQLLKEILDFYTVRFFICFRFIVTMFSSSSSRTLTAITNQHICEISPHVDTDQAIERRESRISMSTGGMTACCLLTTMLDVPSIVFGYSDGRVELQAMAMGAPRRALRVDASIAFLQRDSAVTAISARPMSRALLIGNDLGVVHVFDEIDG